MSEQIFVKTKVAPGRERRNEYLLENFQPPNFDFVQLKYEY